MERAVGRSTAEEDGLRLDHHPASRPLIGLGKQQGYEMFHSSVGLADDAIKSRE